jgi:glycosyltransferase involved in cell wall biosynthesis
VKLLVLTQVLDRQDAILGFFVRWIEGLARRCERVRVVALEVGDTRGLPANVDWVEIGREGKLLRFVRYRKALGTALSRDGFDTVLGHMVPRYCLLAAGPARRAGARHFLWYTHAGVDTRLRRAETHVERIFTASEESLRLITDKKQVTGHGIDLEHFERAPNRELSAGVEPRLLSVGRLTPAKDPLVVLEALALLRAEGLPARLEWVGSGLAHGDHAFGDQVRARVSELGIDGCVDFQGVVPYPEVPERYASCDVLINASHTGSVDKVVLEAMAVGRPVVSCNDSIPRVLESLGAEREGLGFRPKDAADLASKLQALLTRPVADREALGDRLRAIVARDHEVDVLMGRLVEAMGAPR